MVKGSHERSLKEMIGVSGGGHQMEQSGDRFARLRCRLLVSSRTAEVFFLMYGF